MCQISGWRYSFAEVLDSVFLLCLLTELCSAFNIYKTFMAKIMN